MSLRLPKKITNAQYVTMLCILAVAGIISYEWYDRSRAENIQQADNVSGEAMQIVASEKQTKTHESTNYRSPAINSAGSIVSFASTGEVFPRQSDTYQLSIDNYSDNRLQFKNCIKTFPSTNIVLKGGSTIVVEGKSYDPQYIYLGEQEVELNGYDFALVELPKTSEMQTISIDCESNGSVQYRAATISLYP